VERAGRIAGSVLDVGCGTGENALLFANRGCAVTGIDFLEPPIAAAKRKAAERGLAATFRVKDALRLREWTERFDDAIDSGLFHVFANEGRAQYVEGLKTVVKPRAPCALPPEWLRAEAASCIATQPKSRRGPALRLLRSRKISASGFVVWRRLLWRFL
jgi:SAM-dependent methyltransferase